eukprot:gene24786-33264_t
MQLRLLNILTALVAVLGLLGRGHCKAPTDAVTVFQRGEGGYYCPKIPYLLLTSSGALIAFAEGRGRNGRSACDDFAGTDLIFKRSLDGGRSWSALTLLFSNSCATEANVVGNAAPVQDRVTGRIWLPFCRNNEQVFVTYSDDDGLTWAAPTHHPLLTNPLWKLWVPSYHTVLVKGDGLLSRGYTLYSDDHGRTWHIGCADFGEPYLLNECQAAELADGSVLVNARTPATAAVRVYTSSVATAASPSNPHTRRPTWSSRWRAARDPATRSPVRTNLSLFSSQDSGASWRLRRVVDEGAAAYSALQVLPGQGRLALLYERAEQRSLVFESDEIVFLDIQT